MITCDVANTIRVSHYPQIHQIQSQCLGHGAMITGIGQISDGHFLVSISGDKTIRLWNFMTGAELFKYHAFATPVQLSCFRNRFVTCLSGIVPSVHLFEVRIVNEEPSIVSIHHINLTDRTKYVNKLLYKSNKRIYFAISYQQAEQTSVRMLELKNYRQLKYNEKESTIIEELLRSQFGGFTSPLNHVSAFLLSKMESMTLDLAVIFGLDHL